MPRGLMVGFVILAALVPAAAARGPEDSPSVDAVARSPSGEVPQGAQVFLELRLSSSANVSGVRATYCRVEGYACAPALAMGRAADGSFHATIPWSSRFFSGVREVGYKFEIRHTNGINESSPVRNDPAAPPSLPEGADHYYFYTIAPPTTASVLAPSAIAVVLMVALRRGAA